MFAPEYRLVNVFVLLVLIIFHCILDVLPNCFRFRVVLFCCVFMNIVFCSFIVFN